jgi:pyruvate dehydrogenase E2 component (dihydrolipoamide acetyltransferase)
MLVSQDKATLEMEAMEEGYLANILCADGSKDIPVGQVLTAIFQCVLAFSCVASEILFLMKQAIAVIVDSKEEVADFKDYKATGDALPKPPSPQVKKEETVTPSTPSAPPKADIPPSKPASLVSGERIFASPLARKLAEEKNVCSLLLNNFYLSIAHSSQCLFFGKSDCV